VAADDNRSDAPTLDVASLMPLCATLRMRTLAASKDVVSIALDWREELCTTGGLLHGGALMALADSAGGACAFLNLPQGAAGTSTIESKTNFLGAVRDGTVIASARPLHVGRTTIVIETEVRHGDKLVGKVTQTQTVLQPRT
jgi:1,4-dihydroxy-2-naphthoyl-CoA hydrolase